MFWKYLPLYCFVVLVVSLMIAASVLKEGEEPLTMPKSRLELLPTATPRPLVVEYVDAAGIAQRTRERHARECVETRERAVDTYTCAALLQYASHYEGYADDRRAGSKVYWFKIGKPFGGAQHPHFVTYEEVEAKLTSMRRWGSEDSREMDAWEKVLRIIKRERARGNK